MATPYSLAHCPRQPILQQPPEGTSAGISTDPTVDFMGVRRFGFKAPLFLDLVLNPAA